MRETKTRIWGKYNFSRDELDGIASELSAKIQQAQEKEEERKSAASQFKAEIDALTAQISRLANCHRNNYEFRDVNCTVEYDFDRKEKSYIREDNGEIICTAKMTAEELQEEIPMPVEA